MIGSRTGRCCARCIARSSEFPSGRGSVGLAIAAGGPAAVGLVAGVSFRP